MARDSTLIHVNRAHPYTATLALAARRSVRNLVVDMEDWDGIGGYASYSKKYGLSGVLLTAFESAFPRTARGVIVVSATLYARMQQLGVPEPKLTLIPNGYDAELFDPGISGKGIKGQLELDGFPLLIYISNFWPFELEVHRLLLETFREVVLKAPGARLLIVGRGNALAASLVRDLGLVRNVTLAGFVPRAQLPRLVAASDLAVHMISNHPFHRASSPMVIPEYMGMRKAIVAPNVGELATMLGGGAGYLVEYGDSHEMASAILEVANDDSLRKTLGQRAETRARMFYSYEVLARKLNEVYGSISVGA